MLCTWQRILKTNFTDIKKLATFLDLPTDQIINVKHFPLNIPIRIANKIVKKSLNDPILRQFLPTKYEHKSLPGFVKMPVNEQDFFIENRLLKKYPNRALLLCTNACAMHCRYCFRQHYNNKLHSLTNAIQSISQDLTINEVILSGGDPLSLNNFQLKKLILKLESLHHIKKLRIHTRFPIGIPERIDDDFLSIINQSKLQIWFVIHTNHYLELDNDIFNALKSIQKLGIPILSQSVLLKNINDNFQVLKTLFETLTNNGIIPYYLHQLDKVQGSAHFEVSKSKGILLIKQLSEYLPGYAVPKYVQEIPGQPCKTHIFTS